MGDGGESCMPSVDEKKGTHVINRVNHGGPSRVQIRFASIIQFELQYAENEVKNVYLCLRY